MKNQIVMKQQVMKEMIDFFTFYDYPENFILIFDYDQNGKTTLRDLLK